MEPARGFPQAGSAHDRFCDFVSLSPESLHMVLWAMIDRGMPRSLRMIEGFGILVADGSDAKAAEAAHGSSWSRPSASSR